MIALDSAHDATGAPAGASPPFDQPLPGRWNDATVALAALDLALELPQVPADAIRDATAACRQSVPTAAGAGVLRHCIRRRALGLDEGMPAVEIDRSPVGRRRGPPGTVWPPQ